MLAEAIVSAVLLLLLVQAGWWMIAVQARVAVRVAEGARVLDETRLVRHILAAEASAGEQGEDWTLADGELRLRAFRGAAFACRGQPSQGWGVTWSGHREPNRTKDSVLVLSGDGRWRAAKLVRAGSRKTLDCPDLHGFERQAWTLDPAPPSPVAGLFFERGAYRFERGASGSSGGALRYRRDAVPGRRRPGAQPLTTENLNLDSTALEAAPGGGVRVRVQWSGDVLAGAFQWTVWGRE